MPENGVIFSDGTEADHIDFNPGTERRSAWPSPRADRWFVRGFGG
jgi:hypothetical protein